MFRLQVDTELVLPLGTSKTHLLCSACIVHQRRRLDYTGSKSIGESECLELRMEWEGRKWPSNKSEGSPGLSLSQLWLPFSLHPISKLSWNHVGSNTELETDHFSTTSIATTLTAGPSHHQISSSFLQELPLNSLLNSQKIPMSAPHLRCVPVLSHSVMSDSLWPHGDQAPLSMGLSRQEYWSGLPCPPPADFPNPGIEPRSPTLQVDSLLSEPPGKLSLQIF